MKKGLTEIVFVIDMSGSMAHLTDDTIGGFNSFIEEQKSGEGETLVSTVLFNTVDNVIYDRVPLEKVEPMTRKQYRADGCTALLDALGNAIDHISLVHKYIREEDVPEKVLFVITTDGMENSSRKFSSSKIKEMIELKKANNWEFLFVAANIDAVETASHYGIAREKAVNYMADDIGTEKLYSSLSRSVKEYRVNPNCQMNMYWKDDIQADYELRSMGMTAEQKNNRIQELTVEKEKLNKQLADINAREKELDTQIDNLSEEAKKLIDKGDKMSQKTAEHMTADAQSKIKDLELVWREKHKLERQLRNVEKEMSRLARY